jgi:GNAT superfamily N-acetyltransferase
MVSPVSMSDDAFRRELGDGLVLRWSTADDTERLVQLYSMVFREEPAEPPDTTIAAWTRDLMSGRHPLIGPTDFALVEDTRRGAVVAGTCLLSQVCEYGGIPFPMGRPELVATDEAYRNRGFIRAIFELIHARSAAKGHLAQCISGIAYYYRQFGYEYALDMGGSRRVYFPAIPQLEAGATEPFHLRDAMPKDLPLLLALYDRERAPALVSARVDEQYLRWRLDGANPEAGGRTRMIVAADGRAVGCVVGERLRRESSLHVWQVTVESGVSLVAVLPSVLRALRDQAASSAAPHAPQASSITFELGRTHPVYEALGDALALTPRPPYAWYVRVPDLPAFIRHVAPVLEQRLAASVLAGYSGDLLLDFYRGGLRLAFEDGRLTVAEEWRRPVWGKEQPGFPPLVFLQLLFGYRSLDELRHAYPDVTVGGHATPGAPLLLKTLFPPQPSWLVELN